METPDPPDQPPPTYMSPKLREKLYDQPGRLGRDSSHDQPPSWMGPVILGLLAVAVVLVGMGIMRSNAERKRLAVIARADSLRNARTADSLAVIMRDSLRADSIRTAALPKPTPRPSAAPASAPSAGGATAAAPPPAETRKYGLIVGEFIDEARANEVKDQLASSTSLPGRVISVDNGNAFRVILGSFDGRAAADRAAGDLSSKGLVSEARVTALPK
ncbi:MAG TPA: SPOR domain-containing protein [Candidatus Eisenbacteria bacterium]|nr:SPOR domain-containing protein [Candidatus Eisenbacteria bacterium]